MTFGPVCKVLPHQYDLQIRYLGIKRGRPWAGRVLTQKMDMFFSKLLWHSVIPTIFKNQMMSLDIANEFETPVVSFTKEVNPRLAKRPLIFNGRLDNRGLTSLVKEATGMLMQSRGFPSHMFTHEDLCARSWYKWQGQVITSHRFCEVKLLVSVLHTCFVSNFYK